MKNILEEFYYGISTRKCGKCGKIQSYKKRFIGWKKLKHNF